MSAPTSKSKFRHDSAFLRRCSEIESMVLPGLPELEECPDRESESARTYFEEVAESIQEDGLDLLAVIVCS